MKEYAGKILMFVEYPYPQDSRVRNEALLLTAEGYDVSVVAVKKPGQPNAEDVKGVHVYRFPLLELFDKAGPDNPTFLQRVMLKLKSVLGYFMEYSYFTTACFLLACWLFVRRGFDVIHAHNPPDTLFLVALPFKLLGKKFVFDHHDLCPELYQSRYSAGDGILNKLLLFNEWCSLKLADVVIATNESYKQIEIERAGKSSDSIFVVRNGPDQKKMTPVPPSPRLRQMGKPILCYFGSLNPQDGVDYLLRSLHHLVYKLQRRDFYCVVMGSGDSLEELRDLSRALKLEEHVELPGFVSDDELLANLAAADICVDPDPSSPLNNVSTWIKIMEYMAFAKPIVTFDLKETRFSAQDAAVYVPPNDEGRFAEAIRTLMDQPKLRKQLGDCGRQRVETVLQWSVVGRELLAAYRKLLPYQEHQAKPQVIGPEVL